MLGALRAAVSHVASEQNLNRFSVSRDLLARFRRNMKHFLRNFTTVDKTLVHHYIPDTKEQSKQSTPKYSPLSKKATTVLSGKVMATVF